MTKDCVIEFFSEGRWAEVASVSLLGKQEAGWKTATYSGYAAEWAMAHSGARDAWALSSSFPVSLEPLEWPHWPVLVVTFLTPSIVAMADALAKL